MKSGLRAAISIIGVGVFLFCFATSYAATLLSDPFTTNSVDTTKWTVTDPLGTNVIASSSGLKVANSYTNGVWGNTAVTSINTFSNRNTAISFNESGSTGNLIGYGDPGLENAYALYNNSGTIFLYRYIHGVWTNVSCGAYTSGVLYTLVINPTGATVTSDTGSGPVAMSCAYTGQTSPNNQPVFIQSLADVSQASLITNVSVQTVVTAPSEITITGAIPAANQVTLSWATPFAGGSTITDYVVEYKRNSDASWTTFNDGVSAATSATVTGLTNAVQYDFRVSAVNAVGTGPVSVIVSEPALMLATGSGTLFSDAFTSTTIDTTKWTITDAVGTNITQSDALSIKNSFTNNTWYNTSLTSTSAFDASSLTISASITSGTGGNATAALGYGDPNFTGTNTTAYVIAVTSNSTVYATVWSNGTAVENNYCGAASAGDTFSIAPNSTGYSVYKNAALLCRITTTVHPDKKPVFLQSGSSSTASVFDDVLVTNTPLASVLAPTGLVVAPGASELSFSWTAPTNNSGLDITDYIVEYKKSSDSTWNTFDDGVGATTTSTTVTGLTNGTSYDVRVSAVTSAGTGPASVPATTTPEEQFISDTFTDTAGTLLENHVGENGTRWVREGHVTTSSVITPLGHVGVPNNNESSYFSLGTDANADYTINARLAVTTDYQDVTARTGLWARTFFTTFDSHYNGYYLQYQGETHKLNLWRYDDSNPTLIQEVPMHLSAGQSYDISWTLVGAQMSASVKRVSDNQYLTTSDTWQSTPVFAIQASDTTYTSAGSVGFYYISGAVDDTQFPAWDAITVTDAVARPTSVVGIGTSGAVTLQWKKVPSATDYIVEYKKTSDSSWATFDDGVSTNRDVVVTGLTNDTSYDFRVSAIVDGVTSSPSDTISVTPSVAGTISGGSIPATDDEFVGPFDSWLNAKTGYGAVGDGVTDDTAALQAAFDAAASNAINGTVSGTLYIPPGTYRITQTLTINYDLYVSIIGADPATTIIKWDGASHGKMLQINGTAYSRFDRLTFDGNGGLADYAVDQSWDGTRANFDTGNEYIDDVFKDVAYGIYGGHLGQGFAETTILRDQFIRNSIAGVSLGNFNALDIWVRNSLFEDCGIGVTNVGGAGNFKAYNNIFRNSTVADFSVGQTGEFSIRNNTSTNAQQFFLGASTQNPASTIIEGNTIIDPVTTEAIHNGNEGPFTLMNNIFRSRSGVSDGPVVTITGIPSSAAILIGNTFTTTNPISIDNSPHIQYNNVTVTRASLSTLAEQTLPGTQPNLHRQVFEVAPGSDSAAIQAVINEAVKLSGSRPIVHFPFGRFSINNTLFIPANSDVQLVGDGYGFGSAGTVLTWTSTAYAPIISIAGPTKVTLRDFTLTGNVTSTNILVTNVDQPGSRVFMQQFNQGNGQIGLLVNQLDHTLVLGNDTGFGGMVKAMSVIGGPLASAGTPAEGRTIIYDGAESGNDLSHQVSNGGNLMIQDSWYEGGLQKSTYADLSGKGIFTADGDHIATPQYTDVPSVRVANFSGKATFLGNDFTDRFELSGDGSQAKVLALGIMAEDDPIVADTSSPKADMRVLVSKTRDHNSNISGSGSYNLSDTGLYNQTYVADMLSNMNSVHSTVLTSLADGVTDFRIYRVSSQKGFRGLDLEAGPNILNTTPSVDAGTDQTVNLPTTRTTLIGTASDPDGSIASYHWTEVSGPSTATFSAPLSATTSISGLTMNGSYVFRLSIVDDGGSTATDTMTVAVTGTPDTTAPVITNIAGSGVTNTSANIIWNTDEGASTQVVYSTDTSYNLTTALTDTDPTVLSHAVTLSALTACTTYHYKVISTDESNNTATSTDGTVTTTGCSGGGGGGGSSGSGGGSSSSGNSGSNSSSNNTTTVNNATATVATTASLPFGILPDGCTITTLFSATTGKPCPSNNTPLTAPVGCFGEILFSPINGQKCPAPASSTTSTKGTTTLFTTSLKIGDHDPQVQLLQHYLNTHGFPVAETGPGSLDHETNYFGPATKAALMKYQTAHAADILAPAGLKKATGVFATMTMRYVNTH